MRAISVTSVTNERNEHPALVTLIGSQLAPPPSAPSRLNPSSDPARQVDSVSAPSPAGRRGRGGQSAAAAGDFGQGRFDAGGTASGSDSDDRDSDAGPGTEEEGRGSGGGLGPGAVDCRAFWAPAAGAGGAEALMSGDPEPADSEELEMATRTGTITALDGGPRPANVDHALGAGGGASMSGPGGSEEDSDEEAAMARAARRLERRAAAVEAELAAAAARITAAVGLVMAARGLPLRDGDGLGADADSDG